MGKATEWAADYSFGLTGPFDNAVKIIDAKRAEDGKEALSKKITDQAGKHAELAKAVEDAKDHEAKKAPQAALDKAAADFAKLFALAEQEEQAEALEEDLAAFVELIKAVSLDPKAELANAEKAEGKAKAEHDKAEKALNEAKKALEAIKEDADDKGAAQAKVDEAEAEFGEAKAALESAKAVTKDAKDSVKKIGTDEGKKEFDASIKKSQAELFKLVAGQDGNKLSDEQIKLLQTKQFGGKAKFFFAKTLQGMVYVVAFPLALLGRSVKFVSDKSGLVLHKITGGRVCANKDAKDDEAKYVSAAAAFRRAFVDGRGWGFGNTFKAKNGNDVTGKDIENLFANKGDDALMLIVKGAGRSVAKAFLMVGNALFIIPASNVASAFTNIKGYFSKGAAAESTEVAAAKPAPVASGEVNQDAPAQAAAAEGDADTDTSDEANQAAPAQAADAPEQDATADTSDEANQDAPAQAAATEDGAAKPAPVASEGGADASDSKEEEAKKPTA